MMNPGFKYVLRMLPKALTTTAIAIIANIADNGAVSFLGWMAAIILTIWILKDFTDMLRDLMGSRS